MARINCWREEIDQGESKGEYAADTSIRIHCIKNILLSIFFPGG